MLKPLAWACSKAAVKVERFIRGVSGSEAPLSHGQARFVFRL